MDVEFSEWVSFLRRVLFYVPQLSNLMPIISHFSRDVFEHSHCLISDVLGSSANLSAHTSQLQSLSHPNASRTGDHRYEGLPKPVSCA